MIEGRILYSSDKKVTLVNKDGLISCYNQGREMWNMGGDVPGEKVLTIENDGNVTHKLAAHLGGDVLWESNTGGLGVSPHVFEVLKNGQMYVRDSNDETTFVARLSNATLTNATANDDVSVPVELPMSSVATIVTRAFFTWDLNVEEGPASGEPLEITIEFHDSISDNTVFALSLTRTTVKIRSDHDDTSFASLKDPVLDSSNHHVLEVIDGSFRFWSHGSGHTGWVSCDTSSMDCTIDRVLVHGHGSRVNVTSMTLSSEIDAIPHLPLTEMVDYQLQGYTTSGSSDAHAFAFGTPDEFWTSNTSALTIGESVLTNAAWVRLDTSSVVLQKLKVFSQTPVNVVVSVYGGSHDSLDHDSWKCIRKMRSDGEMDDAGILVDLSENNDPYPSHVIVFQLRESVTVFSGRVSMWGYGGVSQVVSKFRSGLYDSLSLNWEGDEIDDAGIRTDTYWEFIGNCLWSVVPDISSGTTIVVRASLSTPVQPGTVQTVVELCGSGLNYAPRVADVLMINRDSNDSTAMNIVVDGITIASLPSVFVENEWHTYAIQVYPTSISIFRDGCTFGNIPVVLSLDLCRYIRIGNGIDDPVRVTPLSASVTHVLMYDYVVTVEELSKILITTSFANNGQDGAMFLSYSHPLPSKSAGVADTWDVRELIKPVEVDGVGQSTTLVLKCKCTQNLMFQRWMNMKVDPAYISVQVGCGSDNLSLMVRIFPPDSVHYIPDFFVLDEWHSYVVVLSPASISAYRDGVLVSRIETADYTMGGDIKYLDVLRANDAEDKTASDINYHPNTIPIDYYDMVSHCNVIAHELTGEQVNDLHVRMIPLYWMTDPYLGVSDTGYVTQLEVNSGGQSVSFLVDPTSLPPGLVVDESSGTISGTPTSDGYYSFNVTAKIDDTFKVSPQKFDVDLEFIPLFEEELPDRVYAYDDETQSLQLRHHVTLTYTLNEEALGLGAQIDSNLSKISIEYSDTDYTLSIKGTRTVYDSVEDLLKHISILAVKWVDGRTLPSTAAAYSFKLENSQDVSFDDVTSFGVNLSPDGTISCIPRVTPGDEATKVELLWSHEGKHKSDMFNLTTTALRLQLLGLNNTLCKPVIAPITFEEGSKPSEGEGHVTFSGAQRMQMLGLSMNQCTVIARVRPTANVDDSTYFEVVGNDGDAHLTLKRLPINWKTTFEATMSDGYVLSTATVGQIIWGSRSLTSVPEWVQDQVVTTGINRGNFTLTVNMRSTIYMCRARGWSSPPIEVFSTFTEVQGRDIPVLSGFDVDQMLERTVDAGEYVLNDNTAFYIVVPIADIAACFTSNSGVTQTRVLPEPALNIWTTYAIVCNAYYMATYVDGYLSDIVNLSNAPFTPTTVSIGGQGLSIGNGFVGDMSHFLLFDTALESQDIRHAHENMTEEPTTLTAFAKPLKYTSCGAPIFNGIVHFGGASGNVALVSEPVSFTIATFIMRVKVSAPSDSFETLFDCGGFSVSGNIVSREGVWMWLTIACSDGQLLVYEDTDFISSQSLGQTSSHYSLGYTESPIHLGEKLDGTAPFKGSMSHFGFYDRVLPVEEIADVVAGWDPVFCLSTPTRHSSGKYIYETMCSGTVSGQHRVRWYMCNRMSGSDSLTWVKVTADGFGASGSDYLLARESTVSIALTNVHVESSEQELNYTTANGQLLMTHSVGERHGMFKITDTVSTLTIAEWEGHTTSHSPTVSIGSGDASAALDWRLHCLVKVKYQTGLVHDTAIMIEELPQEVRMGSTYDIQVTSPSGVPPELFLFEPEQSYLSMTSNALKFVTGYIGKNEFPICATSRVSGLQKVYDVSTDVLPDWTPPSRFFYTGEYVDLDLVSDLGGSTLNAVNLPGTLTMVDNKLVGSPDKGSYDFDVTATRDDFTSSTSMTVRVLSSPLGTGDHGSISIYMEPNDGTIDVTTTSKYVPWFTFDGTRRYQGVVGDSFSNVTALVRYLPGTNSSAYRLLDTGGVDDSSRSLIIESSQDNTSVDVSCKGDLSNVVFDDDDSWRMLKVQLTPSVRMVSVNNVVKSIEAMSSSGTEYNIPTITAGSSDEGVSIKPYTGGVSHVLLYDSPILLDQAVLIQRACSQGVVVHDGSLCALGLGDIVDSAGGSIGTVGDVPPQLLHQLTLSSVGDGDVRVTFNLNTHVFMITRTAWGLVEGNTHTYDALKDSPLGGEWLKSEIELKWGVDNPLGVDSIVMKTFAPGDHVLNNSRCLYVFKAVAPQDPVVRIARDDSVLDITTTEANLSYRGTVPAWGEGMAMTTSIDDGSGLQLTCITKTIAYMMRWSSWPEVVDTESWSDPIVSHTVQSGSGVSDSVSYRTKVFYPGTYRFDNSSAVYAFEEGVDTRFHNTSGIDLAQVTMSSVVSGNPEDSFSDGVAVSGSNVYDTSTGSYTGTTATTTSFGEELGEWIQVDAGEQVMFAYIKIHTQGVDSLGTGKLLCSSDGVTWIPLWYIAADDGKVFEWAKLGSYYRYFRIVAYTTAGGGTRSGSFSASGISVHMWINGEEDVVDPTMVYDAPPEEGIVARVGESPTHMLFDETSHKHKTFLFDVRSSNDSPHLLDGLNVEIGDIELSMGSQGNNTLRTGSDMISSTNSASLALCRSEIVVTPGFVRLLSFDSEYVSGKNQTSDYELPVPRWENMVDLSVSGAVSSLKDMKCMSSGRDAIISNVHSVAGRAYPSTPFPHTDNSSVYRWASIDDVSILDQPYGNGKYNLKFSHSIWSAVKAFSYGVGNTWHAYFYRVNISIGNVDHTNVSWINIIMPHAISIRHAVVYSRPFTSSHGLSDSSNNYASPKVSIYAAPSESSELSEYVQIAARDTPDSEWFDTEGFLDGPHFNFSDATPAKSFYFVLEQSMTWFSGGFRIFGDPTTEDITYVPKMLNTAHSLSLPKDVHVGKALVLSCQVRASGVSDMSSLSAIMRLVGTDDKLDVVFSNSTIKAQLDSTLISSNLDNGIWMNLTVCVYEENIRIFVGGTAGHDSGWHTLEGIELVEQTYTGIEFVGDGGDFEIDNVMVSGHKLYPPSWLGMDVSEKRALGVLTEEFTLSGNPYGNGTYRIESSPSIDWIGNGAFKMTTSPWNARGEESVTVGGTVYSNVAWLRITLPESIVLKRYRVHIREKFVTLPKHIRLYGGTSDPSVEYITEGEMGAMTLLYEEMDANLRFYETMDPPDQQLYNGIHMGMDENNDAYNTYIFVVTPTDDPYSYNGVSIGLQLFAESDTPSESDNPIIEDVTYVPKMLNTTSIEKVGRYILDIPTEVLTSHALTFSCQFRATFLSDLLSLSAILRLLGTRDNLDVVFSGSNVKAHLDSTLINSNVGFDKWMNLTVCVYDDNIRIIAGGTDVQESGWHELGSIEFVDQTYTGIEFIGDGGGFEVENVMMSAHKMYPPTWLNPPGVSVLAEGVRSEEYILSGNPYGNGAYRFESSVGTEWRGFAAFANNYEAKWNAPSNVSLTIGGTAYSDVAWLRITLPESIVLKRYRVNSRYDNLVSLPMNIHLYGGTSDTSVEYISADEVGSMTLLHAAMDIDFHTQNDPISQHSLNGLHMRVDDNNDSYNTFVFVVKGYQLDVCMGLQLFAES